MRWDPQLKHLAKMGVDELLHNLESVPEGDRCTTLFLIYRVIYLAQAVETIFTIRPTVGIRHKYTRIFYKEQNTMQHDSSR